LNYSPILLITINNGLRISGVLPAATLGVAYSGTLTGYGGIEPYSWFISSGALPDGITATQDSNGDFIFSGTPTVPGSYEFVVTLRDSDGRSVSRSFKFPVAALPLEITGTAPDGEVGTPYSYAYDITGGIPPYYFFLSVGGGFGPLPSGLTLVADSNGDPVLSGTPDTGTTGTYTFKIGVNDSQTPSAAFAYVVDTISIDIATLTVTGAFTDTYLGDPLNGSPLAISGGVAPYGLSGSPYSGTRPAGVTISVSGSDLVATGDTTTVASYSWTERVTSTDGQYYDVVCSLDVASNVSALLHCNGASGGSTITDETGKIWTPTAGFTTTSAQSKFGGSSVLLNNISALSNRHAKTPASSDFDFGSGDFTIELWARYITNGNGYKGLVVCDGIGATRGWLFYLQDTSGTLGAPAFTAWVGGTSYTVALSTALTANVWTNIVAVRDGGTLRLYVGGVQQGSTAISGTVNNAAQPCVVGSLWGNGVVLSGSCFYGYLDEIRVTKGSCLYPNGTTFAVQTSEWPYP